MDTSSVRRLSFLVVLCAAAPILAACSAILGPGGSTASLPVTTDVTSGPEAAAAVAARSPLFDGIGPQDPDVIGASAWWTATPSDAATPPSAWTVVFEVGWGDCQAGCIDRHTWTYLVEQDDTVTFQGETGLPLPDDVLAGLVANATGPGVGGHVTAGPVCPVERPGDPSCGPRPVAGATLTIRSGDKIVGTITTDASGLYRFALAPGDYVLEASPVDGLMGTPGPSPFSVVETELTLLDVAYDTGIR
jgi:hypothetical protein